MDLSGFMIYDSGQKYIRNVLFKFWMYWNRIDAEKEKQSTEKEKRKSFPGHGECNTAWEEAEYKHGKQYFANIRPSLRL